MKYIDYCYIAGMHGDVSVPVMDTYFKKRGMNFCVITENYSDFLTWHKKGINVIYLYDKKFKLNLAVYEKLSCIIYKSMSMDNLILTEYSYYNVPKNLLKKKVDKVLKKLSGVFSVYKFDHVIQKPGGEILRRIIYNLDNTEYVNINYTIGESYLENLSPIYRGEFKRFIKVENEEVDENYLRELIEKSFTGKEFTYQSSIQPPKKNKFKVLMNLLISGNYIIIYSYLSIRIKTELIGKLRRLVAYFIYKKTTDLHGCDYYFYPLNVQPESELYVRNYAFSDQYRVLNDLIYLMPANNKLVVKEHPGNARSLSLFQILKLYFKGVVFINPNVKSKCVIEGSKGVIGVSSTVFIESIFYEKPILILGAWSYGKYLLNRSMEFNLETIQLFFKNPKHFQVEKIPFFKELYQSYLVKGVGYKDAKNLISYLNSLCQLRKKK